MIDSILIVPMGSDKVDNSVIWMGKVLVTHRQRRLGEADECV